jgi:hypothetical protein
MIRGYRDDLLRILVDGPGSTAADWRSWIENRTANRILRGRSPEDAERMSWSDAENEWHRLHGTIPHPSRCARCGQQMDTAGMVLPDAAVVHLGSEHGLDCLILYGERWRGAARAALEGMGLGSPDHQRN